MKKVSAKCGCQGCIYETEGCEVDQYIEAHGLPLPDPELWPCVDEENSYIFIEGDSDESRV